VQAFPESRFTPATDLCPHPEHWLSTDDDSTECQVSEMVAGVIRGLQPRYVIETGSAWGQTAEAIGKALLRNGHGVLDTIEPDPERATRTTVRTDGLPVRVREVSSLDFTPNATIDFAFFDSLLELRILEFRWFQPWMRVGTIVAFHDTRPGRDLRGEIESELVDAVRFIHLPTPRGITFGEVLTVSR
jgi:predicted O-methyltransferase YrrM